MFYPGSRIRIRPLLHPGSGSRIRGVKKHRIPDPTYFCIKAINKFCLLIPDPTIAPSRIPDPGGKKHRIPDPDPQHWAAISDCHFKRAPVTIFTIFKIGLSENLISKNLTFKNWFFLYPKLALNSKSYMVFVTGAVGHDFRPDPDPNFQNIRIRMYDLNLS
jgi:hypothetical protein